MKILSLSNLSRKSITNIATAIATADVKGLKAKTKLIIEALAQKEGLKPESFLEQLDKLHNESYSITEKYAVFERTEGNKWKLVTVSVKMKVKGFFLDDKVSICTSALDNEGYVDNLSVHFTDSINGIERNSNILERNKSLQVAINQMFEIANHINSNKKKIKIEQFEKEGWSIKRV